MIYHITTHGEWMLARGQGAYAPESLETEGFIHCATRDQIMNIANFYFKGRTGLLLLEINDEAVASELRYVMEGEHSFPRIYGALNLEAVNRVAELEPNADGVFDFPFQPVLH